jgi:hypothetical protein
MSIYSDLRTAIRSGTCEVLRDFFPNPKTAPVIFSNSNGKEPAETYAVIEIRDIDQLSQSYRSTLSNKANELTIQSMYEVDVRFTFIGSGSGDIAYSFQNRVGNTPASSETYRKNKLGFMRKNNITHIPQKRETQWIDSHNITVTFSYLVNTQQIVDVIDSVELTDELTGKIYTFDLTH